jgi:hypothetical protein
MKFREMDPEIVWDLIKNQKDVLTSLVEKEDKHFKNSSCPNCASGNFEAFTNVKRPFSPGSPLPNKLLRCVYCKTEFDPFTRLITKAGIILDAE